ncbi:MAG: PLP-dependent transferase, partial [Paracoccaceae bacterium]
MRRAKWPASSSTPVVTPLQPSVVYASRDPDALDASYDGREPGYTYARETHPNAEVLAGLIDELEGASGGIVVGSGMAAITIALLGVLKAGDHVIGADQLYGRSLRMMNEELPRLGIETSLVDATDARAVEAALKPTTKLILIETLSNPTLRMSDVTGILALRERGVMVAVDNTFTTPLMLKPLEMGADITIHSVTKLLAGHSDATLGYVAAKDAELNARFADLAATMGVTASPFDCWLGERGLYSFDMRFERASATAKRLADALADSGKVSKVLYPTRPD